MVERVARERPERDRDPVVVKEEPELDDGLFAVLLAHAHLAGAFLKDVAVRIRRVGVRTRGLEEEVRHVVEHDLRTAPRAPRDAGVHALDDLPRVPLDDVERVVDVVVVRAGDEGTEIPSVLVHRRRLGRRVEDAPVRQEPDDPREVVADLRGELDAREELVEAERPEDGIEDRRRHALGFPEAFRVAGREGDRDLVACGTVNVGFERLDKRFPGPERFAQPMEIVGLAVVVPGQRPEIQHVLATMHDPSVDFLEAERSD